MIFEGESVIDMLLRLLEQLVIPNWSDLFALLPWVLIVLVAAWLVFTALHFVNHPPPWAAAVLLPSLLFGYFRDRHGSVLPAIVLHVFYNAGYFLLPLI